MNVQTAFIRSCQTTNSLRASKNDNHDTLKKKYNWCQKKYNVNLNLEKTANIEWSLNEPA